MMDNVLRWLGILQERAADLSPLHINQDGWLEGENVLVIPSHPTWFYPKLSTATGDPLAVVAHVSDTALGTAITMAKNRQRARRPRLPGMTDADEGFKFDRAASWHASIEEHMIVQQARFEVGCWHALNGIKDVGPANRTALGFEFVGHEIGPFPEGQILQGMRLWRAVRLTYGIPRRFAMIQHATIDPERRTDPGPLFMRTCAERILDYAYAS